MTDASVVKQEDEGVVFIGGFTDAANRESGVEERTARSEVRIAYTLTGNKINNYIQTTQQHKRPRVDVEVLTWKEVQDRRYGSKLGFRKADEELKKKALAQIKNVGFLAFFHWTKAD